MNDSDISPEAVTPGSQSREQRIPQVVVLGEVRERYARQQDKNRLDIAITSFAIGALIGFLCCQKRRFEE